MRWALLLCLLAACASTTPKGDGEPTFPIEIEGRERVSDRALRAAARRELSDFLENDRRPADAADAADSMLLELLELGHAHAEVDFELSDERLVFKVKEGPRTYLGSVGFDGVESLAVKDVARFFDFPGSELLGGGEPLFRYAQVERAAAKVERFYLLNGFLRVEVDEPGVVWIEDNTIADIRLTIREGRRYTITQVDFDGIDSMEHELIGAPYHVRLPVESAALLKGRLLKEGYQFAEVDVKREIDEETASVHLVFRVETGSKVKLRNLGFSGQERTKEWFLRRRMPLTTGDLVAQELFEKGISNLYRTGLFSSVRARWTEIDPETADLDIEVSEIEAKSVDLELGYGSYELFRGAARFRDLNIFGTGRRFEAELRGSVKSAAITARLEDPYLIGENWPVEFGAGYGYRIEPSFDRITIAAEVAVNRQVRGFRLTGGYRFRSEDARNATVTVDPAEEGFVNSSGLFLAIRRNTLDSLFAPTSGWVGEVGIDWSIPALGADLDFVGLDLRGARYVNLGAGFVMVIGGRFRTATLLDGSSDLPIQNRVFLGGANDVRSYGFSELGPTENGEPRGGLTSVNATVEFRRKIWQQVYGAVFYDFGLVDPTSWSVTAPAGHGVGAGVRYMLPIGPIRVDVGYNPGLLFAASQRWHVHLAVGFTF